MKSLTIFGMIACVGLLFAPAAVIGKDAMPEFNVNVLNTSLPVDLTSTSPLDVTITNELHVPVTVATYQFVGFTEEMTNGQVDGGIAGMNGLCQDSFTPTARMATTKEYRETPDATYPTINSAWIIPDIRVIYTDGTGLHYVLLESGHVLYAGHGLSCSGWTDYGHFENRGAVLTIYGNFDDIPCNRTYYVSCSDLVSQ